jgi:serine/threonine protein phosphatase PrpC
MYVRDHLPNLLKGLPTFEKGDYKQALTDAFLKIDEDMLTTQGKKDIASYSTETEGSSLFQPKPDQDEIAMHVGCTATAAIITKTEIIVANSGDSRAVLCNKKKAIEMSIDHKPDNIGEKKRIEEAGGFVEENRVKGILNLSRSLGDLEYKSDKSLPAEKQMITAFPEIKVEKIVSDSEFLIIACDGIWDCLTSQEAVNFVSEKLIKNKGKVSKVIEQMFDKIIAEDVASSGK